MAGENACCVYFRPSEILVQPAKIMAGWWMRGPVRRLSAKSSAAEIAGAVISAIQRAVNAKTLGNEGSDHPYSDDRARKSPRIEGARVVVIADRKRHFRLVPYVPAKGKTLAELAAVKASAVTCRRDSGELGNAIVLVSKRCRAFFFAKRYPPVIVRSATVAMMERCYLVNASVPARSGLHVTGMVVKLDLQASDMEWARAVTTALSASADPSAPAHRSGGRRLLRLAGVTRWTKFRPLAMVGVSEADSRREINPMRRDGFGYRAFSDEVIRLKDRTLATLAKGLRRGLKHSDENMNIKRTW